MARRGSIKVEFERKRGKNDQFDKIVQETEAFYDRVENNPVSINIGDVKNAIVGLSQISKEINDIRNNIDSNSGDLDYANVLEKVIDRAEEQFASIGVMFKNVSNDTKKYVTGFRDIWRHLGDDNFGVRFLDVGAQFNELRDKADDLFNSLKRIGEGTYIDGAFDFGAGNFDEYDLERRIEILRELKDVQDEMYRFDRNLNGRDFASGRSSSSLQDYIDESKKFLDLLRESGIETTRELKEQREAFTSELESHSWNTESFELTKKNLDNKEIFDIYLQQLREYIQEREDLLKQLDSSDIYNIFTYGEITGMRETLEGNLSGARGQLKELEELSNAGKNINLTEVIDALHEIREAIKDIKKAFDPLTTALNSEGNAFSAMTKEGSASIDTLLGKLQELGELIDEINRKEFNVTQVFNTKETTKIADTAQLKLYKERAEETLEVIRKLNSAIVGSKHFGKTIFADGGVTKYGELFAGFGKESKKAFDEVKISENIAGADTLAKIKKVVGGLDLYKQAVLSAVEIVNQISPNSIDTALLSVLDDIDARIEKTQSSAKEAISSASKLNKEQKKVEQSEDKEIEIKTDDTLTQIQTLNGQIGTELKSIREQIEATFDLSTIDMKRDAFGEILESIYRQFVELQAKIKKLDFGISMPDNFINANKDAAQSGNGTEGSVIAATDAISKEGEAAEEAAQQKLKFVEANREAAQSADETAPAAKKAAEGIEEEASAAKTAADAIENLSKAKDKIKTPGQAAVLNGLTQEDFEDYAAQIAKNQGMKLDTVSVTLGENDNMRLATVRMVNEELAQSITYTYQLVQLEDDLTEAYLTSATHTGNINKAQKQAIAQQKKADKEKYRNTKWLIQQQAALDKQDTKYKYSSKPVDGSTKLMSNETSLAHDVDQTIDNLAAHIRTRLKEAISSGTLTDEVKAEILNDLRILQNEIAVNQNMKYSATSMKASTVQTNKKAYEQFLNAFEARAKKANVFSAMEQDLIDLRTELGKVEDSTGLDKFVENLKIARNKLQAETAKFNADSKKTNFSLDLDRQASLLTKQQAQWKKQGQLTDEVNEKINEMFNSLVKVTNASELSAWKKQWAIVKDEVAETRHEIEVADKAQKEANAPKEAERKSAGAYWGGVFKESVANLGPKKNPELEQLKVYMLSQAEATKDAVVEQYSAIMTIISNRNNAMQKLMSAKGAAEKQYWQDEYSAWFGAWNGLDKDVINKFFEDAGNQAILGTGKVSKFNDELERTKLLSAQAKDQESKRAKESERNAEKLKQDALNEEKALMREMISDEKLSLDKDNQISLLTKQQAQWKKSGQLTDELNNKINEMFNSLVKVTEPYELVAWKKQWSIVKNEVAQVRYEIEAANNAQKEARAGTEAERKASSAYWDGRFTESIAGLGPKKNPELEQLKAYMLSQAAFTKDSVVEQYDAIFTIISSKNSALQKLMSAKGNSEKQYWQDQFSSWFGAWNGLDQNVVKAFFEDAGNQAILGADKVEKFNNELERSKILSAQRQDQEQKQQQSQQDKINKQNQNYGKSRYNIEFRNYEKLMASVRAIGDNDELSDGFVKQVKDYEKLVLKLKELREEFAKNPEAINNIKLTQEFQDTALQAEKARQEIRCIIQESEKLDQLFASSGYEIRPLEPTHIGKSKQALEEYANEIFAGKAKIEGFNDSGTEMYVTLTDNTGAVEKFTVALNEANKTIGTFKTSAEKIETPFQRLGNSLVKPIAQFAAMYLSFQDFMRYFRQGIQHVRDIDAAMTELKKVTDETEASYANFLDTASKSAGVIGSTVKDFTTVTSDFARLGYSIEEASELAKTALIYENVGDGFNSVEEASESIISTMKAFKIEAGDTMGIVDRFNAVGNNFAITSKGIGDALQRSASALVEGGNSIDEAIGIITAANSVIQNPEQVGTAMKTLSLRLRSTKIELEEMGEDAEGAATSVATLRSKLLGLTSGKVDIMADETTFKNTTQILREMAAVWDEMDDISKAGALELMGGKRQANILSSIISNFETVEEVIETSMNSAGSAFTENQKYIDSIQGRIDILTNSWQTMWNNALNSDAIKTFIDIANAIVKVIDKVGLLKVALGALVGAFTIKNFKDLTDAFPLFSGFTKQIESSLGALGAFKPAVSLASGALAGLAGVGIALAIAGLWKLGDALITTKKEIREAAKEAESAINTIKTEIDSTEDVVKNSAKRFAELSQGIDQMSGKNVSLTTDEYEEFLDLSNQLADTFPTLSRVYDENGNAIVQLSGDTNTVVDSLYDLLEVERQLANQKIADELPDLFKGIKLNSDEYGKELKELEKQKSENEAILEYLSGNGNNFINQLLNVGTSTIDKNDGFANVRKQLLDELGLGYSTWNRGSDIIYKLDATVSDDEIANAKDHIALAFSEVSKEYAKNIDSLSSEIQTTVNKNKANWSGVLSSISAWLTTDESYQVLNDDMQTVVKSMINNIDFSSMDNIKTWDDMQKYIKDNIITKMQSATPEVQKAFTEMFAIDDDQSMKQYKNEIQEKAKEIETLSNGAFKADEVLQSTGYKDILGQYETYANDIIRILDDNLDEKELNKIKSKIYSLSPKEISKALSIVKNYGVDTWESLKKAIDNKTFDVAIDFDVEAEGLEKLETALEETVSAGGLSAEAVGNIKSRYQDLDAYDPATLFEETANGIHLNVQAARELEAEYEKLNKEALDNKLDGLVEQYDNLSEEIANTSDAYKRAELYSKRSNILKQITDTATLAARYEGLTSAYNKWQKAQAGPEERDMYEGILEGKKAVDEEIARGWLDAGTREYIELLSGKDLSTASFNEILEIYKKLNETIDGTKYNVYDFFTKDADDNATVDGIYNFFDAVMAVQEKGKEWVKQNEDGSLSFDFSINGGEEAVAEALGISEEVVQIILRAAADAGFDINLESAYTDLANLKDEATAANDKLKELGATDYTFNINSTDIYDVNKQIEKAKETLDKFKNTDGTIDVEAEGAKEAKTLLATLIYQKQTLDDAIILKMDVENPDTELERVVKKLQDFKAAYNKLEVALAIGEDTTEANKEVQSAISALQAESPSVRATLGIDLLQSHEEINKQIGNITPEMLLKVDPDTTLVDEYKAAEHTTEGELVWHNNLKEVTDWINDPTKDKNATGYVTWYSDTSKLISPTSGGVKVNGTAHARGTAFARGNWGAPKSESSLVGELGPEMVVRGNQWFTVGENGAEFTDVKKGDIIFNHKQTEELLSNGHINGRGKAYASGTAYAFVRDAGVGAKLTAEKEYTRARAEYVKAKQEADDNSARALNAKDDYEKAKQELVKANNNLYTNNTGAYKAYGAFGYKAHNDIYGSSGYGPGEAAIKELRNAGVNSGATVAEEAKQLVDFVETKLENIEATISKTTAYLNNYVDDTSAEGDKLAQYNKLVSEEKKKKNTYSDAESYYSKKAEELLKKVNSKYREMAQNGAVAIEDFIGDKEGKQAEAIQEYREMVNKANEAKVAELEAVARIEEIRLEQFNDLADDYDNVISLIEAESGLIQAQMDLQEAKGDRLSADYIKSYEEIAKNTYKTINELEDKRARMQRDLANAVASGDVKKGSDTWYEMVNAISDVDEELIQCEIDIEEFQNSINDLKWEALDNLIAELDHVDSQLSHLHDRLTDGKVVDDDGNWTDEGIAAMGVLAQQMELAKVKSQQYANAIEELKDDYDNGLYSTNEYNEKLAELTENQWDSIEAYEDAKDAIVELNKTRIEAVKDGMEKEIDAYKELIDKKKESLDADKNADDYVKDEQKQLEIIDKLRRKISVREVDTSASSVAELKRLRAELAEEEEKLAEMRADRELENQKNALDKEYENYEDSMNKEMEALDKYLEDEEEVISDSMNTVKSNADKVLKEIQDISTQYGIKISDAIVDPWKNGSSAVSSFNDNFELETSGFITQLDSIIEKQKEIENQAKLTAQALLAMLQQEIELPKLELEIESSYVPKGEGSSVHADRVGMSASDKAALDAAGKAWNEATTQAAKDAAHAAAEAIRDKYGYSGGSDGSEYIEKKKYAKGTLGAPKSDWAWIDEIGEELVLHAGSNGKLSYLTKGTSVIPADLTSKLMDLVVDPTQTLEASRPIINAPHITNNEITIDASIGEVIHIDTVSSEDIPNLSKTIDKQMDKYMKNLNAQMRKFAR